MKLNIVANAGLGITEHCLSVLSQTEITLGTSQEALYYNIANANLCAINTDFVLTSPGLTQAITRIYNSQATDPWQLCALPHVSFDAPEREHYQWIDNDEEDALYFHCVDGKVLKASSISESIDIDDFEPIAQHTSYQLNSPLLGQFRFTRALNGTVECVLMQTGETLVFNARGDLVRRSSLVGGEIEYRWETTSNKKQLKEIIASGLWALSFVYDKTQTRIFYRNLQTNTTTEQAILIYTHDAQDNLTQVSKRINFESDTYYDIHFGYQKNSKLLTSITQTDTSAIHFRYQSHPLYQHVLEKVFHAMNHEWVLSHSEDKLIVKSPEGVAEIYHLDLSGEMPRLLGYETAGIDRNYKYNSHYDLSDVLSQKGEQTHLDYDDNRALSKESIYVDAKKDLPIYTKEFIRNDVGLIACATETENGKISAEISVYDIEYPTLLRFQLSPEGWVTEYRYNEKRQRILKQVYFSEPFIHEPTLDALEAWAKLQPSALTDMWQYEYEKRGNLSASFRRLPNSDNEIKTEFEHDIQGTLTQETQIAAQRRVSIKNTTRDLLHRAQIAQDPNGEITAHHYESNHHQIHSPQGLITAITQNTAGLPIQIQKRDDKEKDLSRTQELTYDKDEQILWQINSQGLREIHIKNKAECIEGIIDAAGFLVLHTLDSHGNILLTQHFTKPKISLWEITPLTRQVVNEAIIAWRTENEITMQRFCYYDACQRPTYVVDEEGYITLNEYHFGETVHIEYRYTEPLTAKQRAELQTNWRDAQELLKKWCEKRVYRQQSEQFDKDGNIIKSLTGEGVATTIQRAWNGLYEAITVHAIRAQANEKGEFQVVPSEQDSTTIHLYDIWKRKVATLDAEGYLTQYCYDSFNDCIKTIHYAKQIKDLPSAPFTLATLLSHAKLSPDTLSPQDVWQTRIFDNKHQVLSTTHSNGKIETNTYASCGTKIESFVEANNNEQPGFITQPKQRRGMQQTLNIFSEPNITLTNLGVNAAFVQPLLPQDTLVSRFGIHTSCDNKGRAIRIDYPKNETEYQYFDERGLLRFHIAKNGSITEINYDAKKREVYRCVYAKALTIEEKAILTGGTITPELRTLLQAHQVSGADVWESKAYDNRDHVIFNAKSNGEKQWWHYNAYNECDYQAYSLDESRVIAKEIIYDVPNARMTTKAYAVKDTAQSETWLIDFIQALASDNAQEYGYKTRIEKVVQSHDAINQVTDTTDANNITTRTTCDKRGRATQKSLLFANETVVLSNNAFDAFDNLTKQTMADGITTHYSINPSLRYTKETIENETILPPQQSWYSVFDDEIATQDGDATTQTIHNAEGDPLWQQNTNGRETAWDYDDDGLLSGFESTGIYKTQEYTQILHEKFGNVTQLTAITTTESSNEKEILVVDGQSQLRSKLLSNEKSQNEISLEEYQPNVNQNQLTVIEDAAKLKRHKITKKAHNGEVTLQETRDEKDRLIAKTAYTLDGWGNPIQTTEGVSSDQTISSSNIFDDTNRLTSTQQWVDGILRTESVLNCATGLSNITWDARGFATYTEFNSRKQVTYCAQLTKAFTSDEIDALRDASRKMPLRKCIETDWFADASITQHLYTPGGLLRFSIAPEGSVTEHRYRGRFRVATIQYVMPVNVSSHERFTLDTFPRQITATPNKDGKTFFINDNAGRARFHVIYENEQTAYLVEKEYDDYDNVIHEIRYATSFNPQTVALEEFTVEAVTRLVQRLASPRDSHTLSYYSAPVPTSDDKSRLLFSIENGVLQRFDYDIKGKCQEEIRYEKHWDNDSLKILRAKNTLEAWQEAANNSGTARSYQWRYDGLSRKRSEKDFCDHKTSFEPNLFDIDEIVTNKNGHAIHQRVNEFGQITTIETPQQDITTISITETGVLQANTQPKSPKQTLLWNEANELIRNENGEGDQKITIEFKRNEVGECIEKRVHNVPIYDPQTETTSLQDVVTEYRYDGINRAPDGKRENNPPVKIIHPNQTASYTVFDKQNRPRFLIDPKKGVTEKRYDGRGHCIKAIRYGVALDFNDADYPNGIPLARAQTLIKEALAQKNVRNQPDRETQWEYSQRGLQIKEMEPQDVFYSAETNHFSEYHPTTETRYNAFEETKAINVLENPDTQRQRTRLIYPNAAGHIIMTVSPGGHVTTFSHDTEGNEIHKTEYYLPIARNNLNDLQPPELPPAHPKDRHWDYEVDGNGQRIAQMQPNFSYADAVDDPSNPTTLVEEKVNGIRVHRNFLDGQQNSVLEIDYVINQDNTITISKSKITLFTSSDKPQWEIGPARTVKQIGGGSLRLIQFKETYYDASLRNCGAGVYNTPFNLETFTAFEQKLKSVLATWHAPSKTLTRAEKQRINDLVIEQCRALAQAKPQPSLQDHVSLIQQDPLNRVLISQNPAGAKHFQAWGVMENYPLLSWQDNTQYQLDENAVQAVREGRRPATIVVREAQENKLDEKGQIIQTTRRLSHKTESGWIECERQDEIIELNIFDEIIARHKPNEVGVFIRPNSQGLPAYSNENGVAQLLFYNSSRQLSLRVQSQDVDLSQEQYQGKTGLIAWHSLPPEQIQREAIKYNDEGHEIHHTYPSFSRTHHAPEVALSVINQQGRYVITWSQLRYPGLVMRFKLRLQGLQSSALNGEWRDEWREYPVVEISPGLHGVYITDEQGNHLVADNYEYELNGYHTNIDGLLYDKPYVSGIGWITLITPNTQGSRNALFQLASPNSISVGGLTQDPKAGPVQALQLINAYDTVVDTVAVTQTQGQFLALAAHAPRGLYALRRADLVPFGDPFTLDNTQSVEVNVTVQGKIQIWAEEAIVDKQDGAPSAPDLYRALHKLRATFRLNHNSPASLIDCHGEILLETSQGRILTLLGHFIKGAWVHEETLACFHSLDPVLEWDNSHPKDTPMDYPVRVKRVIIKGTNPFEPSLPKRAIKPDNISTYTLIDADSVSVPIVMEKPVSAQNDKRRMMVDQPNSLIAKEQPLQTLFTQRSVFLRNTSETKPIAVRLHALNNIITAPVNFDKNAVACIPLDTITGAISKLHWLIAQSAPHPYITSTPQPEHYVDIHRSITTPPLPQPGEKLLRETYLANLRVLFVTELSKVPKHTRFNTTYRIDISGMDSLPQSWFSQDYKDDKYFIEVYGWGASKNKGYDRTFKQAFSPTEFWGLPKVVFFKDTNNPICFYEPYRITIWRESRGISYPLYEDNRIGIPYSWNYHFKFCDTHCFIDYHTPRMTPERGYITSYNPTKANRCRYFLRPQASNLFTQISPVIYIENVVTHARYAVAVQNPGGILPWIDLAPYETQLHQLRFQLSTPTDTAYAVQPTQLEIRTTVPGETYISNAKIALQVMAVTTLERKVFSHNWYGAEERRWEGMQYLQFSLTGSPDLGDEDYEVDFAYERQSSNDAKDQTIVQKAPGAGIIRVPGNTGIASIEIPGAGIESSNAPARLCALTRVIVYKYINGHRVRVLTQDFTHYTLQNSTEWHGEDFKHNTPAFYNAERRFLYAAPLPAETAQVELSLKRQSGRTMQFDYTPKVLFPALGDAGPAALWDIDGLPIAHYHYTLRAQNASGQSLSLSKEGGLQTSLDGSTVRGELIINSEQSMNVPRANWIGTDIITPHIEKQPDRWGNVEKESNPLAPNGLHDPEGYGITNQEFNQDNQITRIVLPRQEVMEDETNSVLEPESGEDFRYHAPIAMQKSIRPEIRYFYDIRQHTLGIRDARGHYRLSIKDEAGNEIVTRAHSHETGAKVWDIFNQLQAIVDQFGNVTSFERDKNGQTTKVIPPIQTSNTYERNQNGKLCAYVDGNNHIWYQQIGLNGTVTATLDPDGVLMLRAFDHNGLPIAEISDKDRVSYSRNWHGLLLSQIDRSGVTTNFEHNFTNQETKRHQKGIKNDNAPLQQIQSSYNEASLLAQQYDVVQQTLTEKDYNAAIQVTDETLYAPTQNSDARPVKATHTEYDSALRVRALKEMDFEIHYKLDANQNIRTLEIRNARNPQTHAPIAIPAKVFTFDDDDNIVINDGQRATNAVLNDVALIEETSVAHYEKGRRDSLTFTRTYKDKKGEIHKILVVEIYRYDAKGRITNQLQYTLSHKESSAEIGATLNGTGLQNIGYDNTDHQMTVTETRLNGDDKLEIVTRDYHYSGAGRTETIKECNEEGKRLFDFIQKFAIKNQNGESILTGDFAADGTPIHNRTKTYDKGDLVSTDDTTNQYINHINKDILSIYVKRHKNHGATTESHMQNHYNANAGIASVTDTPTGERNKTFVLDAQNNIHERKEAQNKYAKVYYNGENGVVALFERDDSDPEKAQGKFSFSTSNEPGGPTRHPSAFVVTQPDVTLGMIVERFFGGNMSMLLPLQIANIDIGMNDSIPVGSVIKLPAGFADTHFNATKQREVDISRITGEMSPTVTTPKIEEPPSLGAKEIIPLAIAAIVTVVVAYYMAPAAIEAAELSFSTAAAFIGESAVAGATAVTAGEATRQMTSISLNTQHGVDFNRLGKAALIGAVSGGVAGASQLSSTAMLGQTLATASEGQQILASMQTAAMVNLSRQLSDKAATFSWKQLVSDMLLSAIGQAEANHIPKFNSMLSQYAAEVGIIVSNAMISAEIQKVLQNKEINPAAFTLGLTTQLAASVPKAYAKTHRGNTDLMVEPEVRPAKPAKTQSPAQKREVKMAQKRELEEIHTQTSVLPSNTRIKKTTTSATRKPALVAYQTQAKAVPSMTASTNEATEEGFMDYVRAFNRGVEGARDGLTSGIVSFVSDPVGTVTGIAGATREVDEFIAEGVAAIGHRALNKGVPEVLERQVQRRRNLITQAYDQLADAPLSTKIEMGTELVVGAVLSGGLAGGAALTGVRTANRAKKWVTRLSKTAVVAEGEYGVASSQVNRIGLSTDLAFLEANIVDAEMKLTEDAIKNSIEIIKGEDLTDAKIIQRLIGKGAAVENFSKFTTQAITLPSGQKAQIHYYKNKVTGEIKYFDDYKVDETVRVFAKLKQKDLQSKIKTIIKRK
jgi:YD repeat-containing protein